MKTRFIYLFLALSCSLCMACKKNFLDQKPDKALAVPTTLDDFQAILDNSNTVMNISPVGGVFSTDDLYLSAAGYAAANATQRNAYVWAKAIYPGADPVLDWNAPYQQVFYANVVLDGLQAYQATASDQNRRDQIKGAALFFRAFAFYELAQLFAAPYVKGSAAATPGIPIRLEANVNLPTTRSALEQTYVQILNDLQLAASLLPVQTRYKTRPCQAAAFALLARVALIMGDAAAAGKYAASALSTKSSLIDYNGLDPLATFPFPLVLPNNNDEVIFYSRMQTPYTLVTEVNGVVGELYQSYLANDLRKSLFFKTTGNGVYNFRGSYSGMNILFSGLSTDELYLIKAESEARVGALDDALADLNLLLVKRYATGTFVPVQAATAEEALNLILQERRKELVMRNLRWSDLRRLNLDPRFAKTLTRQVNGQSYTLKPNDPRYTFPIPLNVISLTGIPQNER